MCRDYARGSQAKGAIRVFHKSRDVVAWLTFAGGVYYWGVAALVVWLSRGDMRANASLSAHYLGTDYTGEAFDRGGRYLLIAIAMGVAVEISRSLRRRAEDRDLTID